MTPAPALRTSSACASSELASVRGRGTVVAARSGALPAVSCATSAVPASESATAAIQAGVLSSMRGQCNVPRRLHAARGCAKIAAVTRRLALAVGTLVCLACAAPPAQAEDGYELWLRYRPLEAERREVVARLAAGIVAPAQASATLR